MITGQAWASVLPFPSPGDKVKNKVIEYPKNGYVANVMLQNKQIAIWEHISINDISDGKRILEGMVCGVDLYKDSYDLRVSGTWVNKYGEVKGKFKIDNTNGNGFTLSAKKSSTLAITAYEIDKYELNYNGTSISIVKDEKAASAIQSGKTYLLTMDDANHSKSKIEMPYDFDILLDLYNDIGRLLLSAQKARITTSAYSFIGNVEPKRNGIYVDFTQKEGARIYGALHPDVQIGVLGSGYYVKLTYTNSTIKSETWHIDADAFSNIPWWDLDEYQENIKIIDIEYVNGNSFSGTCAVESGKVQPQIGVYRYKNGDIFKGDVAGRTVGGAFVDGTTMFKDSEEQQDGNWLEIYGLSQIQLDEIAQLETPSEKRAKAEQFYENNKFDAIWQNYEMVFVEGGTFTMGATPEQGNYEFVGLSKPTHSVTLHSYYIGKYEVTQELWESVMGDNPSYFKGENYPVNFVSWNDCQEFIYELNQKTGRNYRLPTEAEWEFAARGGKKSRGYKYSGSNTINSVGWYNTVAPKPVGLKNANELGIYDMSGNVSEWCEDWYDNYSSYPQTDPICNTQNPILGGRVIRGGCSMDDEETWGGLSCRLGVSPKDAIGTGLRLALDADEIHSSENNSSFDDFYNSVENMSLEDILNTLNNVLSSYKAPGSSSNYSNASSGNSYKQAQKELEDFARQENSAYSILGGTCKFDGKNLVYKIKVNDAFFSIVESQQKTFEQSLKSGPYANKIRGNLRIVGGKVINTYINQSTGKTITMQCEL